MAEPSTARLAASDRPRLEQRQGVVVIGGAIERAAVVALCARVRPLLVDLAANGSGPVECEVGAVRVDLAAVDALARLALDAGRLDCGINLRAATPALRELLSFAGLAGVLPCGPGSGVDPGR